MSYFYSKSDINAILDKITIVGGFDNLDISDQSILENYSKRDQPIKEILLKINKIEGELRKVNRRLKQKLWCQQNVQKELKNYSTLSKKLIPLEATLRYIYKLEDLELISMFKQKYINKV